jgi:hypothetical protein
MSSATSTKPVSAATSDRSTAAPSGSGAAPGTATTPRTEPQTSAKGSSLEPWQFFVLAGLGCATAATFMARGQGMTVIILLTLLMGTAAGIGMTVLRALQPLVSNEEDRTVMIGQRTRAALEREKLLTLRAIKELEFDRAMGKVSEEDFREMSGRLRSRATRLMRQLESGPGYRSQIERDVAKRLEKVSVKSSVSHECQSCRTVNDPDARFCKQCGQSLINA